MSSVQEFLNFNWWDPEWPDTPCRGRCRPRMPAPMPEIRLPNVNYPMDFGLRAWNMDPVSATNPLDVPSAGELHFARLSINQPTRLDRILLAVSTPSNALDQDACFVGIYSAQGERIAQSADISSLFTATQVVQLPLTEEVELRRGTYFVALLLNGSQMPQLWSAQPNLAMQTAAADPLMMFFDISGPAFTALPDSVDFSTIGLGTIPFWTGAN